MNTVTSKFTVLLNRAGLFTGIVEVVNMDCFDPTDSCIFVSKDQSQNKHDVRGSSPPWHDHLFRPVMVCEMALRWLSVPLLKLVKGAVILPNVYRTM